MQTSEMFQGTGRRKRAVARVRVTLGQGVITINKRSIDDYFPRAVLQQVIRQPLEVTQSGTRFDVTVTCEGGGPAGQAATVCSRVTRAKKSRRSTGASAHANASSSRSANPGFLENEETRGHAGLFLSAGGTTNVSGTR